MTEMLALAAFAALLIYAACSDIARLTIPNWVSIAMAALFVPAALFAGMSPAQLGLHLAVGAGVLLVGFFLFQANVIGGGDAKLLAAAAVWTGAAAFAPFMFWTAAVGGVLALALLAARQFMEHSETNPAFVNRLLNRQSGVPYGVAIMAGGLMALPALALVLGPLTAS
ncbi:MAG: A24 family peptidase [Vitreimonas sp.]